MINELFKIFGDTLPEKHVFFATEGTPTRALLFKEFGSWLEFNNAYHRHLAVQKAEVKPAPKAVAKLIVPPKGATNAK